MKTGRQIIVHQEELPIPVVVHGRQGQTELYRLAPAGKKKTGAYLQRAEQADATERVKRKSR